MRKFLIPLIAAGSALSLAAPASAQWAPPVYRYQPYNYDRGFSYHAFARSMEVRVQRVRNDIRAMQARRILSWREARSLELSMDWVRELQRARVRTKRRRLLIPRFGSCWRLRSE